MLENTWYKLHHQKDFTVGYFGGSITVGEGASVENLTSWRARSRDWLRASFPDVRIHELNACIGGTGSNLGVYRCDEEVTSRHPDLLFFEFSVNDGGSGRAHYEQLTANVEAIFRKVLTVNPTCDIVVVYTITSSAAHEIQAGGINTSREAHARVAYHYGMMQIDVGQPLIAKVMADGGDWLRYTREGVHPNDEGYAILFECVKANLEEELARCEGTAALKPHSLPAPIVPCNPLLDAHLIDASTLPHDENWTAVAESICGTYPRYLTSDREGATLTVPFSGTSFGVYWMMAHDSGRIAYRIDGGEWKETSSFDSFCLSFDRACGGPMVMGLTPGDHVAELKILGDQPEGSKGTRQRIGAFLCDGYPERTHPLL